MSKIQDRVRFETRSTLIALTFLAAAAPSVAPAQAGDWTNASMYNGYGAATQNRALQLFHARRQRQHDPW